MTVSMPSRWAIRRAVARLPSQLPGRWMVSGVPYISVNSATKNALQAPMARQSRLPLGRKKLAAAPRTGAVEPGADDLTSATASRSLSGSHYADCRAGPDGLRLLDPSTPMRDAVGECLGGAVDTLLFSVLAIWTAPSWCSIIMVRNVVSKALPEVRSIACICCSHIMPGMPEGRP